MIQFLASAQELPTCYVKENYPEAAHEITGSSEYGVDLKRGIFLFLGTAEN